MAKILILIIGHLCNAPRPQKEAEVLASAGHDVTVRGIWFDAEYAKRDSLLVRDVSWQFSPILDFRPKLHRLKNLQTRVQSRLDKECYSHFNIFHPELLGYGAKAMLRAARQSRADLTIVHSEAGLWVGNQLLNEGYRVGVDFEDWFSEDLLPEARITRPIARLKDLEQRLIRECQYCLTTSQAMAMAMAKAYQAPEPSVIYNSFPWSEREHLDHQQYDRKNPQIPSIHWFSQTIGPGRGLELLFQALPYLHLSAEIHLRGKYSDRYRQWLEPLIPPEWRDRVFIHPTVPNNELLSRIAEHDVGLALETSEIPSRNLTITNKLFQYLQAGLAIIATDTVGQREVFSQFPAIGRLISSQDPVSLAYALENLLGNSESLAVAKSAALNAFQKNLNWENQSKILMNLTKQALN